MLDLKDKITHLEGGTFAVCDFQHQDGSWFTRIWARRAFEVDGIWYDPDAVYDGVYTRRSMFDVFSDGVGTESFEYVANRVICERCWLEYRRVSCYCSSTKAFS